VHVDRIYGLGPEESLAYAIQHFRDRFAVVTSFQSEGMVVLDMAAKISPSVRVFTLDTGRLPEETYEIIETVRGRYGVRVELVSPDPAELEAMVTRHGPNLFYESLPYRNLCCHMRKVRPLERKLAGVDAWAVGLRRSQTESRDAVATVTQVDGRLKLSPLANWTSKQVEEYTRKFDVPQHPLYAHGYTSIGCAPCTRATAPGEAERAGRWWWEHDGLKECGIHFTPDGRVQRTLDVLVREIVQTQHA
jgi:phosphoadenosine phosphosulfate reductase